MNNSPLWLCLTYLYDRARQRTRAAMAGEPESGALTLEWIVIGGIMVGLALASVVIFHAAIAHFTGDLTTGNNG